MPSTPQRTLTDAQVRGFVEDGFVRLPAAFPRSVAQDCTAALWRMSGLDPDDPSTWTQPVVRIEGSAEEPFRQATNTPALLGAFDQIVGAGRWVPRGGLGTFPLRFPYPDDPGDAGWHVDASYAQDDDAWPWLNLRSRGRALLMLFLFTDVGPEEAPTRIKAGSHLDVPPFLAEAGERGRNMLELCQAMDAAGRLDAAERPTVYATGQAGDVYLCHPFLIHGAQPHHGSAPRFIAQPPLEPVGELELERADGAYTPVEEAVRRGLGWAAGTA
ncbi:phytanoyl-CoA dioxygenase family protein [Streptomyces oceani]|uniref:Phytanoyl-CoA dioxygenase n=1 Tax=Streptomyces oceani TaxID=1075402 RepID=A0A1E7JWZ5_9ACTN|nr:phytanoyl-CoA dioxygenase family protein [Streptomyces oceani]OEU96160.1 phytanoyl-CoA dioxygenase [Streptomyces oceani]